MNSFIISSGNFEEGRKEATRVINTQRVDPVDIETLEFEKTLGIEDVRNIQKKIFLRPLRGEKKATVLMLFDGATIEAQNSMLKLLEEPPPSSLIFLVTNNAKVFLPTILSRVKLIEISSEKEKTNTDGLKEILSMNGAGDSLYLAQSIGKDKSKSIAWLESAILSSRDKMLENLENKQESLKLRKLIHQLELTHYDLKTTNANPRLALENLFLNLN